MLNDLKEFEKFLKLCRKQGVMEVTLAGVSVKLGDLPAKSSSGEESDEIPTDGLSDDEMIYYHLNGKQ